MQLGKNYIHIYTYTYIYVYIYRYIKIRWAQLRWDVNNYWGEKTHWLDCIFWSISASSKWKVGWIISDCWSSLITQAWTPVWRKHLFQLLIHHLGQSWKRIYVKDVTESKEIFDATETSWDMLYRRGKRKPRQIYTRRVNDREMCRFYCSHRDQRPQLEAVGSRCRHRKAFLTWENPIFYNETSAFLWPKPRAGSKGKV